MPVNRNVIVRIRKLDLMLIGELPKDFFERYILCVDTDLFIQQWRLSISMQTCQHEGEEERYGSLERGGQKNSVLGAGAQNTLI